MNDDYQLELPPTQERVAELAKLYTPVFKQLITLNASAIGLVVIFLDQFTPKEENFLNVVVAFALLAFLGSLLGSFMMYFRMTMMQLPDEGEMILHEKSELVVFWLAFMGFVSGVLCLMMVAWLNFINALPAWVLGAFALGMIVYAGFFLWKRLQGIRNAADKSAKTS